MSKKTLAYYLALPYTTEIITDVDEEGQPYLFARVVELPGCMTEADDYTELGDMIHDAKLSWLETALEDRQPIPEPRPVEDYSGKFVVRVPKSLHKDLAQAAKKDGVSLNSFVNVALGKTVGTVSVSSNTVNIPKPVWPQLSDAAWQAMIATGLEVEAQTLNEQIFSGWLEKKLQQVEAALEIGSIKDAIKYLKECQQALQICGKSSPLMSAFHQSLKVFEDQIKQIAHFQASTIQLSAIDSRARTQLRNNTYPRIQEEKHLYSDLSPDDKTVNE